MESLKKTIVLPKNKLILDCGQDPQRHVEDSLWAVWDPNPPANSPQHHSTGNLWSQRNSGNRSPMNCGSRTEITFSWLIKGCQLTNQFTSYLNEIKYCCIFHKVHLPCSGATNPQPCNEPQHWKVSTQSMTKLRVGRTGWGGMGRRPWQGGW